MGERVEGGVLNYNEDSTPLWRAESERKKMASAKTRAMGKALGRRALFGASKAAAWLMEAAWPALALLLVLGAGTACLITLSSPLGPGIWPAWQREIAAPLTALGLIIWGAFDARRGSGLFDGMSWSRPARSALRVAMSGFVVMMDRLSLAMGSGGFGVGAGSAKRLPAPPPAKSWRGDPTPLSARECLEPVWSQARRGAALARLAPAFVLTMLWGFCSLALTLLILPLAVAELALVSLAGGALALARGGARAKVAGAMERLVSDSAEDLAREERRDLEERARAGAKGSGSGPRGGL